MISLRRRDRAPIAEPIEGPIAEAVATWWCQATPGTTYVRAQVPARQLPGRIEMLDASSLQLDENDEPYVFGQEGDTSIWQFPGNATRAIIMAELQEQGYKVMVEVDDNYLKPPPPIPGLGASWLHKLDRTGEDRHSYQAHTRIVKWCDGVIVTTPYLADRYASATDAPIFVCPNSIAPEDWPVFGRPAALGGEGPLRVGYAGSASHVHDLAIIDDALDWAYRDGAQLVKMGVTNVHWRWPHLTAPWENTTEGYRRVLAGAFDIGLCPLKRGEWQDGKSDIKVLEYLSSGILPVVQEDSPCYAEWVDYLPSASTPKEWRKVVRELVTWDRDSITQAWSFAFERMLETRTIDKTIHTWREAIA